ncbi:MAG: 50S ribosomal protein L5 [Ignavibacteria bacterium]|nr:50S ribosomal protein L5 [Bacteroidota bacterium]MSQ46142.1 50S ribosomal protein L5 [Ignavibacteria bacterium]
MAKEKKIVKSEKIEVTIGEAVPGIYPRLMDKYKNDVIPALMKELKYKNVMAVPKLDKIAINSGVGVATQDAKILEIKIKELEAITGQKVVTTKSKKAISNFKLRENMAIGAKVTLRGKKMYEFLDRLINVAIPQIRDFRGVSNKSFDGFGNYTMGIKEQIIFREIDPDKTNRISGMDITFVTTAKSDNEAKELLKNFGMPFIKQ